MRYIYFENDRKIGEETRDQPPSRGDTVTVNDRDFKVLSVEDHICPVLVVKQLSDAANTEAAAVRKTFGLY